MEPSEALQGSWEHFPHQADIGVRGIGATKKEAFEREAQALTAVITDLEAVAPTQAVPIVCESVNAVEYAAQLVRGFGVGGEALNVTIPAGTQHGTALRVKGKGMPNLGSKGKGDLFVVVEVRAPTGREP